jgi:hypothetical protein
VSSAHNNSAQVRFTRQQIEWIEKQFPEVAGTPNTSDAELRFRSGQRSVIAVLRERVAGQQEN